MTSTLELAKSFKEYVFPSVAGKEKSGAWDPGCKVNGKCVSFFCILTRYWVCNKKPIIAFIRLNCNSFRNFQGNAWFRLSPFFCSLGGHFGCVFACLNSLAKIQQRDQAEKHPSTEPSEVVG